MKKKKKKTIQSDLICLKLKIKFILSHVKYKIHIYNGKCAKPTASNEKAMRRRIEESVEESKYQKPKIKAPFIWKMDGIGNENYF